MNQETNIHTLSNGLAILTRELHHVPLVSQWIWYRVGSRNETIGITGISHWVEHMQFKGTKKFPADKLDQSISRDGGFWNAMTHLDWTTYFETMPAHKIDIALELEADRMQNSLFEPEEVEKERTVIISEREGNENEPMFRLGEAVRKASFQSHPYRQQVIGDMQDLRTMTRENLVDHYKRYYAPDNAVIAIAGDFDTDTILDRLTGLYEDILPASGKSSAGIAAETVLPEGQTIEVEGPGDTIYLELNFRSPPAAEKEFFHLLVLDSLLTGPASIAMVGGGSVSNKTSRLYQSLVEKDLAMSVSGGLQATIDPYLYSILTILQPEQDIQTVIDVIDEHIRELIEIPIDQMEINRAIKQAKAIFAFGSESITNQAFWMGYAAMFADPSWFDRYIQSIEAVTPQDIRKTAEKFLRRDKRVIGIFKPRQAGGPNGK